MGGPELQVLLREGAGSNPLAFTSREEEEMVKDYTRPRALQRAAWAAKGKDNVLAAQNWGLWLPHFFKSLHFKGIKKIKEEKKKETVASQVLAKDAEGRKRL